MIKPCTTIHKHLHRQKAESTATAERFAMKKDSFHCDVHLSLDMTSLNTDDVSHVQSLVGWMNENCGNSRFATCDARAHVTRL